MMFNCSYFDKSILNIYSPMSLKMFLGLAVGQRWASGGPAMAQQWPPGDSFLKMMQMKKTGENSPKTGVNGFLQKTESES